MQVRVRNRNVFLIWSSLVIGQWLLLAFAAAALGLAGKLDGKFALLLVGAFGGAAFYHIYRIIAWMRQSNTPNR